MGIRLDRQMPQSETEALPGRTPISWLGHAGTFRGHLDELQLSDLLQILHSRRRTVEVSLHRNGDCGQIIFYSGDPIHAQTGDLEGLTAFYELCSWEAGEVYVQGSPSLLRWTIQVPLMQLLLADAAEEEDGFLEGSTTHLEVVPRPVHEEAAADPAEGGKKDPSLTHLCQTLVECTPDGVAATVVDLTSGTTLGWYFTLDLTTDHIEAVSFAAVSLCRGRGTPGGEAETRMPEPGLSVPLATDDVFFSTAHFLHLVRKLPESEVILCLMIRRTGSIETGWACLNAHVPKVIPCVPC
jgi:Domain of unknown function (DUF4388)